MNVDELQEAYRVLSEVSTNLGNIPETTTKPLEMCLHIQIVNLFLSELALRLVKGEEPYDALLKAAEGDTPFSEEL
ncbi:MAG: hypothetical protein IPG66_11860 [Hydrogenophilales bacterium]|nr:hypothetical protein [Hydrogenophilales bacterium]